MNQDDHEPALPSSPAPAELVALAGSLSHPAVEQTGLTTTMDGRWALLVRVPRGTPTPLAEVEQAAGGHPVVYQPAPDPPPVARPAFPERGE